MPVPLRAVLLSVVLALVPASSASAEWTKPGRCAVPDVNRELFADLTAATARFSTERVPCYIAAYTLQGLLADGRWTRSSFRYRSNGARWIVRLSCRGEAAGEGRLVTCRVRSGTDAETRRSRTRDLSGGRIRWRTTRGG